MTSGELIQWTVNRVTGVSLSRPELVDIVLETLRGEREACAAICEEEGNSPCAVSAGRAGESASRRIRARGAK
jgi:hypothetical protein